MDNAPRPGSPDLPYGTPSPGNTDFMNLTVEQRRALQTVERVGASLSLVGVCLVFVSFAAFKRLRTVPNTFILFASIANVGASVACLIGYDGLNAGDDSALCQIQGFLLEMCVSFFVPLICISPGYTARDWYISLDMLTEPIQVHAIRSLVVSRHGH